MENIWDNESKCWNCNRDAGQNIFCSLECKIAYESKDNIVCPKCKSNSIIYMDAQIINGDRFIECVCCEYECSEIFFVSSTTMLENNVNALKEEQIEIGYYSMEELYE